MLRILAPISALIALLWFWATPCEAGLVVSETPTQVVVKNGPYQFIISKTSCSVFTRVANAGIDVATGGRISYLDGRGGRHQAGAPVKTWLQISHNRVYQEGWFESQGRRDFLYYVIRYEFYPDQPYVKLVATFTDRHDRPKTEAQWDKYWLTQLVSDIKVELQVPGVTREISVEQHNAFDYKMRAHHQDKPYIVLQEKKGAPYQFTETDFPGRISSKQLQHSGNSKENWVRFYPMKEGSFPLSVIWKAYPDYAAYLRANGVVATVHHARGESRVVFDQDPRRTWLELGTFNLDRGSYLEISGERSSGRLVVDAVRAGDTVINLFNRHDDHLAEGPFTLFVKDFWRNYPIAMQLSPGRATVDFVKVPTVFMGGMGKTFEIMYAFGRAPSAQKALYRPPEVTNSALYADLLYFSTKQDQRYELLTDAVRANLLHHLEAQRSLGWQNWGDYQIGSGYDGVEDWGNLQYDLAYGLLVLYLRTRDPAVWQLAQASVYHLMDLDLVKFSPFVPKYNGSVHRKGEMQASLSHVASEPIVPENFAFRSLYLYYLLTGDQFAYRCAKMSVDNFLEFTVSEARLDFASQGDRDSAWILLGLLFGYEKFHDELYLTRAKLVTNRLLKKVQTLGRLPGTQPVWQGQTVEALIRYYEITKDEKVKSAIIKHVTWLRDYALSKDRSTGRYKMIYSMGAKDLVPIKPSWSDDSNYFFLHLNSFMYVYTLTGDLSFQKTADALYSQASADYRTFAGPRQASTFLSFPFYYLEHRAR